MVKIKRTSSDKAAARRNIVRKENKFFKAVKVTFILGVAFVLAAGVSFNLYLSSLPPINNLDGFKPNIVTKFYSHDGEIIKTFTAYTYSRVDIKNVPQDFINALIATEDKNFYNHHGYDLYGLARSTVQNLIARKFVQGASTITQQLARILFLSNEKTFDRKLKELVIAARIEKTISKEQILEMYMNNVYLGSGAYGVEGAAEIYFNKKLKELSLPELALIAGLPQAARSTLLPFGQFRRSLFPTGKWSNCRAGRTCCGSRARPVGRCGHSLPLRSVVRMGALSRKGGAAAPVWQGSSLW